MWIWIAALAAVILLGYKLLPNFYALKGNFAYEKGGIGEAVKEYEKAYKTNRASAAIRLSYADLVLRDGRFEEAETLFTQIILDLEVPLNKKNSAKQQRCVAYIKQNKIDDAYEDAQELLESYQNSGLYAIMGYAMILKNKPKDEILKFCREAYEYNKDNRDVADNYAQALILSGEYEKAIEILDKVIERYRFFPEVRFHKALCLKALGKKEEAKNELELLEECDFENLTSITDEEIDELQKGLENA